MHQVSYVAKESSGRIDSYFILLSADGISVNRALCKIQPYIYIIPAVMFGDNVKYFGINTPKTRAGQRIVPMIASVKEALLIERENQRLSGITSRAVVDGYEDFIFVNRFGNVQNQGTLNKAIRRITRDSNQEIIEKANGKEAVVLLPRFSCHSLRHTFTTRLCELTLMLRLFRMP